MRSVFLILFATVIIGIGFSPTKAVVPEPVRLTNLTVSMAVPKAERDSAPRARGVTAPTRQIRVASGEIETVVVETPAER